MKNPAIPESMVTTTTSKLKMPQFIPWAIGESDAPKQAAQAQADGDDAASMAKNKKIDS